MRGAITPLSHKPSWRGVQLKHGDNTLTYHKDFQFNEADLFFT